MLGRLFPRVGDYAGAKSATKAGVIGAGAFAGMVLLGLVFTLATGHLPNSGAAAEGLGRFWAIGGILVELAVPTVAAWRFHRGKGFFIGLVTLLLFALEVVEKFASGTANAGWVFMYLAIAAALINGLRGAWALRGERGRALAEQSQAFD